MKETAPKNEYTSLRLHSMVAERFRIFSKTLNKNNSETLSLLMDVNENKATSPSLELSSKMIHMENKIQLRINYLIAILKNIEKHQTKPTVTILNALLDQTELPKKPLMVEKKLWDDNFPTEYKR